MKTLAFAFALLALFMVTGQTQVIKQNDGAKSTVRNSTFTVVGTGSACFSVDDPTLVVDCGNNRVGVNTTSPATTLDVNGNAQFGSGATKSTFTATGALTMASAAEITKGSADGTDNQILRLSGGGAFGIDRGGGIQLMGNENGDAGDIYYDAGSVSGASHVFRVGATLNSLTLSDTQTVLISTLTKTYVSGSAHVCVTDAGLLFASEAACP